MGWINRSCVLWRLARGKDSDLGQAAIFSQAVTEFLTLGLIVKNQSVLLDTSGRTVVVWLSLLYGSRMKLERTWTGWQRHGLDRWSRGILRGLVLCCLGFRGCLVGRL